MNLNFHRKLSIAPMLDYTDRHFRHLVRLLTKNTLLYTEMIPANALVHADPEPFLKHSLEEAPVALQLGGGSPETLALAAKKAEDAGYQEINLNCGCPSDRVQNGSFGACLMKDRFKVARCIEAMQKAVQIPVTVKCRIGIDHEDSVEFFMNFIQTVHEAGCDTFIIHARKAWLKGLSPKENRDVPPLNYDRVIELKKSMPHLNVSINGGIKTLEQTKELLHLLDGVMIGRAAYENPWMLRNVDSEIYGMKDPVWHSRKELLNAYLPYVEQELAGGCPLTIITRHLSSLFNGLPGSRKYRQMLSENAPKAKNGAELLLKAMDFVEEQEC